MPESIQVRLATIDDSQTIVDYQLAMAMETESLELHRPTVALGVAAVFDDSNKGTYWIAQCDDRIVGSLLTIPEWSDWRNGTVLWIHSVYIEPGMRRRGVFCKMYGHLKQQVERSDDLRGLRLYVARKNHPAQSAYQSLGMTKEHYEMYEWMP
jgi:GNAT superfamily N-acetyltransferase